MEDDGVEDDGVEDDGVEDGGTSGEARVVVEGALTSFETIHALLPLGAPAVTMRHEYVLRPGEARLEIRTLLTSTSGLGEGHDLADLMFWGGETLRWIPGLRPGDVPQSAAGAMLLGEPESSETAPSAWAAGSTRQRTVLAFGPIFAFVYETPQIVPETVEIVRWVALGEDTAAAAASVREALGLGSVEVTGQVANMWSEVSVEARDADGGSLVRCRPDVDGAFSCVVPSETTTLAAVWDAEARDVVEVPLTPGTPIALEAPQPATVSVSVTDAAGDPLGFRLTAVPGGDGQTRRLVDVDGDGEFHLPPDDWELWVTAGPTRERFLETATLAAGETLALDVAVDEVVDRSGWFAADLHVHAELSPDSHVPMVRRLAGAVAEGLDYIVMTDHDHVTDAGPWLDRAGVSGQLVVRTGLEVSTMRAGHYNVWPLETDGDRAGDGALDWHGLPPLDTLAALRGAAPDTLVQCNHPRFVKGGYAAIFEVVGLDPEHAEEVDAAALDCDLLEIVNGFAHQDVEPVMADWAALLNVGIVMAPTGTSDCHDTDDFIGHARTWVRAPSGSAADIEQALRAGHTMATAGPFVTVNVAEAWPGETHTASEDNVTATVRVQAPDWLTLGELRVLADGVVVYSEVVAGTDVTVDVPLDVSAPGTHWVAAYHVGGAAAPPATHRPGNAVTAPVWIER